MGEEKGTAKAQRQEGSHSVGTRIPLRSHHCHHQCKRQEWIFKNGFCWFFCLFVFILLFTKEGKGDGSTEGLCREHKLEPTKACGAR